MAQPVSAHWEPRGRQMDRGRRALSIIGLSLELILAHGILSWLPLEELGMSWRVTSLRPGAACASARGAFVRCSRPPLQIALAMNSPNRTRKPRACCRSFTLVPLLPGLAVSMLDLETDLWMYAVPMLSNQTLLRELAKGQDMGVLPFAMTFLSSLLPALAIIAFASWRMKSERYVLAV
jgi:sodium transport system permease protein